MDGLDGRSLIFAIRSGQWRGGQGGPGGQFPPPAGLKTRGATEHKGRQKLKIIFLPIRKSYHGN